MKVLFVDDEPHQVQHAKEILSEALDVEILLATSVAQAIEFLEQHQFAIVVTDIFIPMGKDVHNAFGPRARKYEDSMRHLGGLALLDYLERLQPPPPILAHTACTDHALIEVLGQHVVMRLPKPAPVDVLLTAVRDIIYPKPSWI